MEPAHSEAGDCRVEPPASILVARLSMSHLVPLLEFNLNEIGGGQSCEGCAEFFEGGVNRFSVGGGRLNEQVDILGGARLRVQRHGIAADDQIFNLLVVEDGQ